MLKNYLVWLALFSALVMLFEILWPARDQKVARKWLWSDYLHLVFNGHILGLLLFSISSYHVLPHIDVFLAERGLSELFYFGAVKGWGWGIVTQAIVALVILDFVQWLVHNTLHRVNFLWEIHKVHHSVKDGEMDWIVSFRFSWLEPVIYKGAMYLPMMWFGFHPDALFFHAVFGTLIGHLNHANLTWDYGPLRYVFNSPRMHLYHHAYDAPAHGQNFGITLSCWDWIFGTSHLPDEPCPQIGFPGVERVPNDFFGQLIWPLPHFIRAFGSGTRVATSVGGLVLLGGLYGASLPPTPDTPMFDEPMASSQPSVVSHIRESQRASTPKEFERALKAFGERARQQGWAHPEFTVSAAELAVALGAPQLKILDVRAGSDYQSRFAAGHVPSALLVTRADYSSKSDIPGVSLSLSELELFLRERGINRGDEVVLMGDGGPEPYRLWWTLYQVGGLKTRVLDGGLAAWKRLGEGLAGGGGHAVEAGDIKLSGGPKQNLMWRDVASLKRAHPSLHFLDTRSRAEFIGENPLNPKKAARLGRIPGAHHLLWTSALKLEDRDVPVLKTPAETRATFEDTGLAWDEPLVTYCQSGTRSAAVFYGLLQAGFDPDLLWNYDGSWAEYSRSSLEVAVGAP